MVKQLISVGELESWHVDDATAATQLDRVFQSTAEARVRVRVRIRVIGSGSGLGLGLGLGLALVS